MEFINLRASILHRQKLSIIGNIIKAKGRLRPEASV